MSSRTRTHQWTLRARRRLRPGLLALEDRTLLATFTVTNTGDSGAGSLRAQLAAAGNGDTIVFDPAVFGTERTITLTGSVLSITKDVTIQGPGANLLTISGNSAHSVFNAAAPGTRPAGAILSGLTVSDAVVNGAGGAILNAGTLTIRDCAIAGNTAWSGAGVENSSVVTLIGCTVSGNTTTRQGGGGLINYGAMTLIDCTVTGNAAAGAGGAIFSNGASLSVSDSTIVGNTSATVGGITANNGLTINNSILAGNAGADYFGSLTGSHNIVGGDPMLAALAYNGGPTRTMAPLAGSPAIGAGSNALIPAGIAVDQRGVARISQGTVDIGAVESGPAGITVTTLADEDNGGADPGAGAGASLREALALANAIPGGGATIGFAAGLSGTIGLSIGPLPVIAQATTIAGPGAGVLAVDAKSISRVLQVVAGVTASISGLTLTGGLADAGGGGILNAGTLTVDACVIANNSAPGNGGGIDNLGTLTLTNSTVSGNSGKQGGGIFSNNSLTMTGDTVSGNAGTYGGGIKTYAGTASLTGCTVSGNTSPNQGGGLYLRSTARLVNCTVDGNTAGSPAAPAGHGGGIAVMVAGASLTMTGGSISGNTSPGRGGGLYSRGPVQLSGVAIRGNASNLGGGVYSKGTAALDGCTVSGNTSNQGGGLDAAASLSLTRCTVSGNNASASGFGGGINSSSSLSLTLCTISGNTGGGGGGVHAFGQLNVRDSTLSGNTAGGGIWNFGTATLIGSTISGNHAVGGFGGGIRNNGSLAMTNCTVFDNTSYNGPTPGAGGGVWNYGTATLTNCTVGNNHASFLPNTGGAGGNLFNYAGKSLTLNNSIVAYGAGYGGNIAGIVSGNNNLIDDPAAAGGLSAANGNILSSNLRLRPPGDYGGPTKTVALFPDSPAVGAGNPSLIPAGIITDQRGFARVAGSRVDIGAYQSSSTIVVTTLADEDDGAVDPGLGSGTSLREAIAMANADPAGGDTIAFAAGLRGTLALTLGALPTITSTVIIAGPGARLVTIDAQRASRILNVAAGADATVSGLTLTHGSAASAGGAVSNAGTLTLAGVAVTDSVASQAGGGVANSGTMALVGSTVSGDRAGSGPGGGIINYAAMTVRNCTVAGNSAGFQGGGLFNVSGASLTITNSTVVGNSAARGGGGLSDTGTTTLNNTIVAGNSGGDVLGSVGGRNNLIGDAASAGDMVNGVAGNIVGVDPKLGPLAYNGGQTQTMALLANSPALDAGDSSLISATTDQRGAVRVKDKSVDIGAFEAGPSVLVVDTLSDANSAGTTLREAIDYVNAIDPTGGVTIAFAPGLSGTIALTQGALPDIAGSLAIAGPGANLLTIDARSSGAVLTIDAGASVVLFGLTLTGGFGEPGGGGVTNSGSLLMSGCVVAGNGGLDGGGINNDGTLRLIGSTISGNTTLLNSVGGGLYNSGTATLINSTVANNFALYGGGGIYNAGSGVLTLEGCTVAGNQVGFAGASVAGGGIFNAPGGKATLTNTIVAGSNSDESPGGDIAGTVTGSNDLVQDAASSGGLVNGTNGNIVGVDPKLGALASNGGSTRSMRPLAGSPAIDAGSDSLVPAGVTTDQRGAWRIRGARVDIGAVEGGTAMIVVTTLADEDDGTINPFSGAGTSLREAIAFANADPGGGDTIAFSPLLKGSINLGLGALPTISAAMTIEGPGANVLAIDGLGASRIFWLTSTADVAISGLTLAHGRGDVYGGAILNRGGTLSLTACTLSGNTARIGGGLYSSGTATLVGCTLSGNAASTAAGAAYSVSGRFSLTNCTVSGNTAPTVAGIALIGGTNTILASTISGNTATSSNFVAGVYVQDGASSIADSIVAGNVNPLGASDLGGTGLASGSNDVIGTGSVAGSNNRLGVTDPGLAPLSWNGGTTQTMAILPGSPALGLLAAGATTLAADQRGLPLDAPAADAGAFQYQGPPPTATIVGAATGTTLVATTFTIQANDPSPADQAGTFTYTIDWDGDGTDVQVVQGPYQLILSHAYAAAGAYTPKVSALDAHGRASARAALPAPIVVSSIDANGFTTLISTGDTVTINLSSLSDQTIAQQLINSAPEATWKGAVNLTVTSAIPLVHTEINPTSPNAVVTVSGSGGGPLESLFDVSSPFGGESQQGVATIAVIVALAVIGGAGLGSVGGTVATDFAEYLTTSETGITGFFPNLIGQTGIFAAGVGIATGSGVATGVVTTAAYISLGASPALVVDQGKVSWSDSLMGTATDSSTVIVKGGSLNLDNNIITGTPSGDQPLIEVDGGTMVLGANASNRLAVFGSAPFVNVAGTGKVIVAPGNSFFLVNPDLTSQAATGTAVVLASSAAVAATGQSITYTATVTAGGSPATGGRVEFFDDTTGVILGFATVTNGTASIGASFNAPTAGDAIYATYLPETGALAPSSGHLTQVVSDATTTSVTGPAATPVYGQSITFTATVTAAAASGVTPAGAVEFYDGAIDLGAGTVLAGSGGSATSTFTTSLLSATTHAIRAVFTPAAGSTLQGSYGTLSQIVSPAHLTVSVAAASKAFGQAFDDVSYVGTITGIRNGDAITATFRSAGDAAGAIAGSYSIAATLSDGGSGKLAADYVIDSDLADVGTLTVTPAATTTGLSSSANPSARGQSVTFTAVVAWASPGVGTPAGSVTFRSGSTVLGTVALAAAGGVARASVTTAFTSTGSPVITASFTSTDGNGTASSGSLTESVQDVVLEPDPADPSKTALVVGGTTGNDLIAFVPDCRSGGVQVVVNGASRGTFSPTGRLIAYGQSGNDAIAVSDSIRLPALLFGGDGSDALWAGGGDAVLVGGNGNDALIGGLGRDILIGGDGADILMDRGDDDILIAGTTDYDADAVALSALLGEWARADEAYATRVGRLAGGITSGGSTYRLGASTVHTDTAIDVLYGGSGTDWYFARVGGTNQDVVLKKKRPEVVTAI
ncbi:RTX-I toxin determinant A from serotypes 1/9 [Aquisphaera giovannonii]|uniref:RTX-I toxin determinant A from serotypes 1/9 n=1 Tax=Aquisphaera giovannonii TaxID=406548 RepID=A0A5B9WGM6_9BACT|nr:choice-of-anchor Q domain-containing protein [Aquisphaera giovannonii]QEH39161.1 RTX-I toxin determinant A from serotypes 1/9 [Aquisphaera giovannonii]